MDPDEVTIVLLDAGLSIDSDASVLTGRNLKEAKHVLREARKPVSLARDEDATPPPADVERFTRVVTKRSELKILTCEEVLRIHDVLCVDFGRSEDPIFPPGVRSISLLESAVGRQASGWGDHVKHGDPLSNAATLAFGLCNNHPFHNGNKRTALVSMLAHLDGNRRTLKATSERDMFRLMLEVATHTVGQPRPSPRQARKGAVVERDAPDSQVAALVDWLTPRVRDITRGERELTYRQLDAVLQRFGYHFAKPRNNSIAIYKTVEVKSLLGKKREPEYKRIGAINFPGEREVVGLNVLKQVRKMCRLREEEGVDAHSFYDGADVVSVFINKYRTVLRRLGKQ